MNDTSMLTPNARLRTLMLRYGESHQNVTNKQLHMICVPAIMLSTLGMIAAIPTPWNGSFNFAHVLVLLASIYYAQFRNFALLAGIWILTFACFLIISTFGEYRFEVSIAIFVIAWIGQFIGHKIEGKKPSFFEDIFFLLIGPLWVLTTFIPSLAPKKNSEETPR